ncbi:hypothetical protein ACFWA5_34300 [Streptomyces mirabilis]|uniref:hypothetical protein n=1 Tax=Streptomyces mirabilis TaxID=68239 RepID=UPI00364BC2A4
MGEIGRGSIRSRIRCKPDRMRRVHLGETLAQHLRGTGRPGAPCGTDRHLSVCPPYIPARAASAPSRSRVRCTSQAAADDIPQKDICEATGYTRRQVRRIVLAGESETVTEP